jgi:WD40 repeat protein/transcriptional regulator with XRE-family HTH domain
MSVDGYERGPDPTAIMTKKDFAQELALLRERAGLTVREVAKKAKIQASTAGGYFSGRHLPATWPPNLLTDLLRVCGVTDEATVEEWGRALRRARQAPGPRPSTATPPYRGLECFQPEDTQWFFGREALTELLVSRLFARGDQGRPLLVVGPSGSGKSSLLRAGLIPAVLHGGQVAVGWSCVFLTPGSTPVRELVMKLAGETAGDLDSVSSALSDPAHCAGAARSLMRWSGGGDASGEAGSRRLVVVDQFEELFTLCSSEADRRAFIAALTAMARLDAVGRASDRALVVLGMRADFYHRAARYPELVETLQDGQVVVGPMAEADLRRAIAEPARRAGLDLEDGLVDLLLRDLAPSRASDAAHDAGALPLLSHTLLACWQRARRGRLTIEDYRRTGGITGAVACTAEDVYATLTEPERDAARRLFLRLVHVDDDAADTRRRVACDELLHGQEGDLQRVLALFVSQRLITADADVVELSHEALLTAWPRLRDWLEADRAGLRLHRQLTDATREWLETGRDRDALYRGGRLEAAREWAESTGRRQELNPEEAEFLDTSIARSLEEQAYTRRRTRRLYQLLTLLTAMLLIAGMLAGFAFQQRRSANTERDLAISRQVAIEADRLRDNDPALAAQLALAAYRIAPTVEARSSLLDSSAGPIPTRVLGSPGIMQSVALTADGRTMATSGSDRVVRLWNLAGPDHAQPLGRPLAGHTDTVYSVAFSPNGHLLATGSGDRTVRLWTVGNPVGRLVPREPTNTVYSVAFSPDGRTLAAGSADNTVHLWDLTNPARPRALPPLIGPTNYVQSVAFSPDGDVLAAGSADGTVRLWALARSRRPVPLGRPLTGAANTVFSVAFSLDGRILAAGSRDKTVRLWDITNRRSPVPLAPLTGPQSWVNSVAFNPDGRDIAVGGSDNTVRIYDLGSRRLTASLPHTTPVTAVVYLDGHRLITSAADGQARIWRIPGPSFSAANADIVITTFAPDGKTLLAGSSDNSIGLWDISDPRHPIIWNSPIRGSSRYGPLNGALARSPNGHTLAAASTDGHVELWDITDLRRPISRPDALAGPVKATQSVAFSPDGRTVAAGGDDHTVWLWDITNPGGPRALGRLTGPTNYVYSVTFAPDGRTLAAGSVDNKVWLWDVTDREHPVAMPRPLSEPTNYIYSVAFTPDSHILAAGSADHKVWLWDVSNPQRPRFLTALSGPTNYVFSVAFDPDGRTLAAASADTSVWLWDITDPNRPQVTATLTRSVDRTLAVEFSPDGHVLASGTANGTVRLWLTDPAQAAALICAESGDPVTANEWAQYLPGRAYTPPC